MTQPVVHMDNTAQNALQLWFGKHLYKPVVGQVHFIEEEWLLVPTLLYGVHPKALEFFSL